MVLEKNRITYGIFGISILMILYCILLYNKFTYNERILFSIGCFFILVNIYLVIFSVRNKRIIWLIHIVYPIIVFLAIFLVNSKVGYIFTTILLLLPILSQLYYGQCIINLQHSYNGGNYQFLKISHRELVLINITGLMILLYRYNNSSASNEFIVFIYLGLIYFLAEIIIHNYNLTDFKKFSLLNSNFSLWNF